MAGAIKIHPGADMADRPQGGHWFIQAGTTADIPCSVQREDGTRSDKVGHRLAGTTDFRYNNADKNGRKNDALPAPKRPGLTRLKNNRFYAFICIGEQANRCQG